MRTAKSRRRLVLHEDDVGMCHGANAAFFELTKLGVCSSGAVMVPCPWFLELAEAAANDPQLDVGVHLTLNAEKSHYKWGPLTAPSRASGLIDDLGFFHPDVATTRRHAHPEAIEAELRAQIETAYAAGIDVTHLDAHMGCALAPEFCDIYVRLGLEYRLPILLTSTIAAYTPNDNLVGVTEDEHKKGVDAARTAGFEIFDSAVQTTWGRPRSKPVEPAYRAIVEGTEEGLTFFCLHFNAPGEIELIEPRSAYIRTEEYDLFRSDAFRDWLHAQDLDIVGMKPLRDDLRARLPSRDAATAKGIRVG
ncbi:polysaccharide deacetylase family protein [Mesorhizobium marinum]|uniref:polysaccharide deacetylase family protein n=1 Tax=Mesorhizobium marinum TaxID=3228790 RepID=UPI0034678DF8